MSDSEEKRSRRGFLAGTGISAGALAIGVAGSNDVQGADARSTGAIDALLPTASQMQEFLALPDDGSIVMVNLLKFKPDGGQAEYAKYAAAVQPILEKLGAKVLFLGKAQFCLIGQADWDMVALVQYPRKKSLLQMSVSPEYRAIHHHREAGLQGQINYAVVSIDSLTSAATRSAEVRPGVLRTPDEQFTNLPGFEFKAAYKDIDGYRVHYLDEGPVDGQPILLLHGEPTWCYLYRTMLPRLTGAGYRCIVPDLIGFGRSDKPVDKSVHTYKFHVDTMAALVKSLELTNCTFFGQDWGGLIGLRVVAENEHHFGRIVVSNTGLPTGEEPMTPAFMLWRRMSGQMLERGEMPIGDLVAGSAKTPALQAAYDAPFPDKRFQAGPLMLPQLVPIAPDDPATAANKQAWEVLRRWRKPFLTAYGDGDPITRGADQVFQRAVPGCKNQAHATIKGAGHFIQETHGEELARVIVAFIAQNPLGR